MIKKIKNDGGDGPDKNKQDVAAGNKNLAEQQAAQEVADKVGFLFDTFRNPETGEVYSFRDVEAATEGKLSYHWLWKLANAHFSSPGLHYLKLLTDFFQVDPKLWFRDLDDNLKGELVRERDFKLGKAKPLELYRLALRDTSFDSLEPEEKQLIFNMIEALKKNKESDK
ncbi:MAG: hypothetical protein J0I20_29160 [Chloroflexi bacterium]|jgi:hypothetical protein|nr:hypothetical protein [Chloroflexota bacterium]OJV91702.1 MAG: hypothetical protein BGO39_32995 [Chloroflexi bacterium 54-19]